MAKGGVLLLLLIFAATSGCGVSSPKQRYRREFYGLFDTVVVFSAYADTEEEFDKYAEIFGGRLTELHKKFDIYSEYEGLNNLRTVNENAGIAPVAVDGDIIALLEFSKGAYYETEGAVNIALGPVLRVWGEYRQKGLENPENAEIPPMDVLQNAAANTDIENVVIDGKSNTVFLKNPGMSLDVGATAKGFAAGLALEAAKAEGLESAVLDAGGNIVTLGIPADGRSHWEIGVKNPEDSGILDTIYVTQGAVVTSGAYQRYYTAGDKRYGHIIDPATLMPAERYASAVVLHSEPGVADMLSTACFILSKEESEGILEEYGAEALWVTGDGGAEATEGYKRESQRLFRRQ